MATDRAAGVNSLRAELEMLGNDIEDYRTVAKNIAWEDLVGLYVVAGRHRWRAEQLARQDMEELEESLQLLVDKAKGLKADMVYGFEEKD